MANDLQTREPDEALQLAEDVRRVVGGFVRRVRQGADTPSAAWSETLGELDRGDPASVAALARRRNVRHQSMRLTVAQLEADGLVRRQPHPADTRGQLVRITAAGRTSLARSRAARADWIADGLRSRTTDRERKALRTALTVLQRLAGLTDGP